jgi:hypothetical protein
MAGMYNKITGKITIHEHFAEELMRKRHHLFPK